MTQITKTPDHRAIYRSHAREYQHLVSFEDYEGNILPALERIRSFQGIDVVELGAGTGRISRLLASSVKQIRIFDISPTMLQVAASMFGQAEQKNWAATVADNRALPVKSATADVAIAGWSLGHFTGWYPDNWREEIGRTLTEMKRVLRPGGNVIILETQGTGLERPQPPTRALATYYSWLERKHGFAASWIRTDYRFDSISNAFRLVGFFFGVEMAARIIPPGTTVVPECTGIWWLTT
jgi:ubiquinone/menaquinone biosynthesis C-methylase UbiE